MGRGRVELKRIENVNSRQVSFSKRHGGFFKKANELAVLCDAEVGVIVFSSTGKLYEFASCDRMEQILARYNRNHGGRRVAAAEQHESVEMDAIKTEMENLQKIRSRMVGKELDDLSYFELQNMEQQLAGGIVSVKEKKERVLLEQQEKSKLLEQRAVQHNEKLLEKIEELQAHAKLTSQEATFDTSLRLGFTFDACSKKKFCKGESSKSRNTMDIE